MKKILTFIMVCTCFFIYIVSCTDKDDATTIEQVEPGVYNVEMDLSPMVEFATKGIKDNNSFDSNYDPDFIYLHKIGSDESLLFPVYNNCPDTVGGTCRGFAYRMVVDEAGNATITPRNTDGTYSSESITLSNGEECYFSSWSTDDWQLNENQISSKNEGDNEYYFYYRDKNINKEIYRSESNISIYDLSFNSGMVIQRACAGFNVIGLFYNSNDSTLEYGLKKYVMDENKFKSIMGSSPNEWYIKIYIGGECYPDHYNLETNTPSYTKRNGYYSSGDGDKFTNEEISDQKYLPFRDNAYLNGTVIYQSMGYYTQAGNHLFTPVNEKAPLHIYFLIKHWRGTGDPDEEWLKSDIGALQTTLVSGAIIQPKNNNFYTLGLVMDLTQFKNAWDAAGGDEGQKELEDQYKSSTSTTMTRSPSGAPVREFTLKDAKVICDVTEGI